MSATASAWLALMAGASCDDGITRGPDGDFVADFAFGAYVEPDGPGRISELFVVTADGRRRYVSVGLRGANRAPALNPDGKRIVFEFANSAGGSAQDLYLVDVDRRAPVNLTESSSLERDAAWSPRGDRLAFVRDRGAERSLEIIAEDGSGPETLLATAGWLELGGWSPDGAMVVAALSESAGRGQILTVTVPAGLVIERTDGSARRGEPVWSPDGRSIAYVRDGDLWCLRLETDREVHIPLLVDSVGGPLSWTLDARSVVMTGYTGTRTDVCRADLEDSSLTLLTRRELGARDAAVLPDGRRIAYLGFDGLGYQLYTMDLQGFNAQRVTSLTVEEFGPVARPLTMIGRMP